ncbi:DUF3422 domain-containing protein [Roseobacter sp. HKCCA0434]|uniref:DUF3422 family protein n=1 Tax=Roseobacter sp. HKCCA0434 TaxID=3079297 RepID=UPI0029059887|nr:DUF3422 domain-containing protein [Roseobacter sp. HKCCA0434]
MPKDLTDHPERIALANELHARPFPPIDAPSRVAHLAILCADGAQVRGHLCALLDRHGAQHPAPDARHWSGDLGRAFLKWERHTEFVTYTLIVPGLDDRPFTSDPFGTMEAGWLDAAPGTVLTSAHVRVERAEDIAAAEARATGALAAQFVPESLALSRVVDGAGVVMTDYRVHEGGHARIAVVMIAGVGRRRTGRIVQRMLEIETYKAAALLALPLAREVSGEVAALDTDLSALVGQMARREGREGAALDRLLAMSARVEEISAQSAFRFGAQGAYAALVDQRIAVLREERIGGRQTLAEFMMRRFEPAMRTCESAEGRLEALSSRLGRAANLLRTRVDVGLARQNTELLASMDKRAASQLRLQETVEGVSVVAISYYAVGLLAYVLGPVAGGIGIGKAVLLAVVTPLVALAVWWMLRRRQG